MDLHLLMILQTSLKVYFLCRPAIFAHCSGMPFGVCHMCMSHNFRHTANFKAFQIAIRRKPSTCSRIRDEGPSIAERADPGATAAAGPGATIVLLH